MIHQTRPWLGAVSWQTVIDTNQKLYDKSSQDEKHPDAGSHPMTQKQYERTQELWEHARPKATTLEEALQQCRQCQELAPFTFHNSETFAEVAVVVVEELLSRYSSIEAQILKNTIHHFVTGDVGKKELRKILHHLGAHARESRDPVNAPATVPAVHPQPQAF